MISTSLKLVRNLRRLPLKVVMAKIRHRLKKEGRARVSKWRAKSVGLSVPESWLLRRIEKRGRTKEAWLEEFAVELAEASYLAPKGDPGSTARDALLDAAADAMLHRFDLLGSGPLVVRHGLDCPGRLGHRYHMPASADDMAVAKAAITEVLPEARDYVPIDWHLDFISGYRWDPWAWHGDIAAGPLPGVDIKVPWELSRFQHLIHLGAGLELTGDRRYATEIQAQILDFILSNPVGFGPCWVCPMDVAIRVANWLPVLGLLASRGLLDHDALWVIARSLLDHGHFIENNLEWSPDINGNHYASDLAGLLFIGRACPGLPSAGRWLQFARRELEAEIGNQVQADGTNFEGSTCYHRLVFEIFLHASLLETHADQPFSKSYESRLIAMRDVLRNISLSNGEIPQIGDNDSGRFIVLDSRPFHSLRVDHLLPLCDAHVGEFGGGLRSDVDETPLWWMGLGSPERVQGVKAWTGRPSIAFKDSGWVILRRNGMECVIACGPNGQGGNGGHAHNDKLSIVISKDDRAFVVDPGNFVYSPSTLVRNEYRSTRLHNTPQPGDREINALPGGRAGLFTLPDRSRTKLIEFSEAQLVAEHSGFDETVTLDARLDDGGVATTYSVGNAVCVMRWHLHPDVQVDLNAGEALLCAGQILLRLVVEGVETDLSVRDYEYSPAYGRKQPAKVLEVGFRGKMSSKIGLA